MYAASPFKSQYPELFQEMGIIDTDRLPIQYKNVYFGTTTVALPHTGHELSLLDYIVERIFEMFIAPIFFFIA